MSLFLHKPNEANNLDRYYKRAFEKSSELFIVSAYLTNWDSNFKLNKNCTLFRLIVGKDFGITRKAACTAALKWLPPKHKAGFFVADQIDGFHPKAVFWREHDGTCFTIIGSSNLTKAAFKTNFEANIFLCISEDEYQSAVDWMQIIQARSRPVSKKWIREYKEAKKTNTKGNSSNSKKVKKTPNFTFELPTPSNIKKLIAERRDRVKRFGKVKPRLTLLFRDCVSGKLSSSELYEKLDDYWGYERLTRLQGAGWERTGRTSNFRTLSKSIVRIIDANAIERDDIVVQEIDHLTKLKIPTRGAFLSEILCLYFPDKYHILNNPIRQYFKHVKFSSPRGASAGAKYLDMSNNLRYSLTSNPNYPAKNLVELDTVIQHVFRDE